MASQAPGLPPGFVLDPTPSAPQAPAQPRAIPRTIYGPPREAPLHTQQTPSERVIDEGRAGAAAYDPVRAAAEARKAAAEAQAAEDARRRGGLTAEQFNSLHSQYDSLGLLENGINEVDQLYRQNYQGRRTTLGGYLPNIVNPTARQFEAASNRLMSAIASAQGLSAQQQNTPTELRIRFGPMVPLATDDDATIEDKLAALRDLLNTQRRTLSHQLGLRENPGDVERANAAAVSTGAPIGAAGDGTPPPSAPIDPNRVQPGENMGQVGTLPIPVSSDPNGRNIVSGEGGTVLTADDRRLAGVATALANSRLPADQAIARINAILSASGRQLLTPEAEESIRSARANHSRHPGFSATPSGHSQGGVISRLGDTAGGAAVINYLDTASLGLPALLSGDYREGVEAVREAHPIASTVGAIAGGLIAPGGPRPGMSLGQQSLRSGGQGLVYGFNESGGDPENALIGGGIGAAAPGVFRIGGRAASRAGNALFGRAPVTPEAQALATALEQEGIPGSRPLLDPAVRDRMAVYEASPGSAAPVREGLEATRAGIERRVSELPPASGTPQERGVIGERIQDASDRYIQRSGDIRTRLYDRAAQIAGDAPVQGREAVQAIDNMLAELAPNAPVNQGQIGYLENLRRTFVDEQGNLIPRTVQSIRDLRTEMRTHIDNGTLTRGPAERRVLNVLGAAKQDIERDLGQVNPAAVRAYQRADRFNAERAGEIRQVVQRVVGRRDDRLSGEQTMGRLAAMARADSGRLDRLWQKLSPDEQADAAATIAEEIGRKGPDESFSLQRLIQSSRNLSPAARRTIFGDDGARSITNLVSITQALQATQKSLNNSRSGVVANWRSFLSDLAAGRRGPAGPVLGGVADLAAGGTGVSGAVAGYVANSAFAGVETWLRNRSARTLMNPDLSRWLAVAPRATSPSAIRKHIDRLATVARTNPAISQEVTGLRQALLNAVNDNSLRTGRVVASPQGGPDDREQ